jgi:predicted glycoside hydrolase/deacetylase ChbG (UPF0249 family)
MNLLKQVETEWSEQIKRVIEVFSPRQLTALDGHIHIHMLPFLFPLAARLASRFSLTEIRVSREYFHFVPKQSLRAGFAANILKHFLLNALARSAYPHAHKFALRSPDSIVGVLYSGRMTAATARAGLAVARKKRLNSIEMLFHPGRAASYEGTRWPRKKSIERFYMHPSRDRELEALLALADELRNKISPSY